MKAISSLAIAFTYVGTIVGAGFASGQEIKEYFADYGVYGLFGIVLASFLIALLGRKIMLMCKKSNIESYDKLLKMLSNNVLGKLFDVLITIFLIGSITTMCAGMGTILNQVFNIPFWSGSFILMITSITVVRKGVREISKVNIIVVPVLILVTIAISITSFGNLGISAFAQTDNVVKSVFSSVLYVAYNIVMAISILPSLSVAAEEKDIKKGSIWSGIIIAFLGLLIALALLNNYDIIQNVEIPLAMLSKKYIGFYVITFILEVFSTAVSSLYGVYGRINKKDKTLYIIATIAYFFSLFGFSNLITYLYRLMGVIGIFMICTLIKGECR